MNYDINNYTLRSKLSWKVKFNLEIVYQKLHLVKNIVHSFSTSGMTLRYSPTQLSLDTEVEDSGRAEQ